MRRWPLPVRIAVPVLLALLVVHSAGWWWLSRQVRDGYVAWAAQQSAMGRTVRAGEPGLTGWPVAAGVALPGLAIDGPGWRWTAEHVALTIRPWAPGRLRVEPSGRQSLVAGPTTLGLEASSMLLTLALPAGDDPVLDLAGAVLDTPAGRVGAGSIVGGVVSGSGVRAYLDVSAVSLPPGPAYPLGASVAEFDVQLSAAGPLPAPRTSELAAWRDGGGTMRLDAVHLRWGRLTVDAAGTAGLDRALQPLADVRAAISGQDAALDQAVAQGFVQPRAAMGIRAVLGLFAGAQTGTIPVAVHDGTVTVAGFPVARVPTILWP